MVVVELWRFHFRLSQAQKGTPPAAVVAHTQHDCLNAMPQFELTEQAFRLIKHEREVNTFTHSHPTLYYI